MIRTNSRLVHQASLVLFTAVFCLAAASCAKDPQKLKAQHVAKGDQHIAKKEYAEAILEYRLAVSIDGSFGEARFKLGEAYTRTGDLRNALREYVRAADLMPNNVEAQVRAGGGLLLAGQYPEAKARALAALAKEPKNTSALMLMGNALAGMKDLDGAITQIEEAIESDPTRILAYANLGALKSAQRDGPAAEAAFRRAIEIEPHSPFAHLALGNYYWASNDLAKAESEFKTALANDPQSVSANRALAVLTIGQGRLSEAETYLKGYAQFSPGNDAKIILADFYLNQKKSTEATAVLQPLLQTKDGFIPAKRRLAVIDFVSGRHQQAYEGLEEVFKREPKNEEALVQKGQFLMAESKPSEALAVANLVVERNPKSVAGHFLKGMALKTTGANGGALDAFHEVLKLDPTVTAALIKLAEVNFNRGDNATALEFAGQAIKKVPQSGLAHLLFAKASLRLNNLSRVETEIKGLERGMPKSPEVQTLIGDLALTKHDFGRARQAYERALSFQTGWIDAVTGLVQIDLAEKHSDAARSRIEAALQQAPESEPLLLLAGKTFLAVGDAPRAETTFRHILDVNPGNIQAYRTLATFYLSQRRLDEARKEFEEISKRDPKAAVAANTMVGTILAVQGKEAEARKQFQEALAADPQSPVAANNLAWDYAQNDQDLDMALQLAKTAKSKLPDNAIISDTLGWVYYKKGMATLAISSLKEATAQAPSNPSIHYRLGLAYLKNGNQKEARSALEQALKLNPQFKEAGDAKRALATIKG